VNRYGRGGRKTFEQKQRRARKFQPSDERLYLAFFKPFNVVTQFTPPENDQQESLANFGFPKDVYPVGRLDTDSEGLLILSDDTRLNNALLDPENEHERTYWVQVDNEATDAALDELRRGVVVQGRKTKPCRAHRMNGEPDLPPRAVPIRIRKNIPTSWISLTLTEGKNRQVRRMTAAVGHPTLRLVRWSIGSLTLADLNLSPGEWTELELEEVWRLFG